MPLAERFGLWAALSCSMVVSILWFAWKREVRMANRIDKLEEDRRLSDLATAKALETNGILLQQIASVQQKQLDCQQQTLVEFRCRPCLKES